MFFILIEAFALKGEREGGGRYMSLCTLEDLGQMFGSLAEC